MHNELIDVGLRWVRMRVVLLVLSTALVGALLFSAAMLEPGWPPHGRYGAWQTVGIGAALGAGAMVLLLLVGSFRAMRRAWPIVPSTPAPDLVPSAEALALARGIPVPRVWLFDSTVPNVACLPGPHGRHIVVSTTAAAGLTSAELEAVMAMQLGLLLDGRVRLLRRAIVAASLAVRWMVLVAVVVCVVSVVRAPAWSGLTLNAVIWGAVLSGGLVLLVRRRLLWSWGVVSDGVAIETTRFPDPLVDALRKLAGHNDGRTPVRASFGATDVYWTVTVRKSVSVATMVTNGKARARTSTAMVSDAAMLLRARVVELCTVGGRPATLASWNEARNTIARLAEAAGDYGGGDSRLDGVVITTEGAVGSLAPIGGTWDAAALAAGATIEGTPLFARPKLPPRR